MNEPIPLRGAQNRRLPLMLPADLYDALAQRAQAADRDPIQEARHIIRQAVESNAPGEIRA